MIDFKCSSSLIEGWPIKGAKKDISTVISALKCKFLMFLEYTAAMSKARMWYSFVSFSEWGLNYLMNTVCSWIVLINKSGILDQFAERVDNGKLSHSYKESSIIVSFGELSKMK